MENLAYACTSFVIRRRFVQILVDLNAATDGISLTSAGKAFIILQLLTKVQGHRFRMFGQHLRERFVFSPIFCLFFRTSSPEVADTRLVLLLGGSVDTLLLRMTVDQDHKLCVQVLC